MCEKARDISSVLDTLSKLFQLEWNMKSVSTADVDAGVKQANLILISISSVNSGKVPRELYIIKGP
jgi:hypothetical protein